MGHDALLIYVVVLLLVEHGDVDRSTGYANAKVFLMVVLSKLHENVSAFYRQLQASTLVKSSPENRVHAFT